MRCGGARSGVRGVGVGFEARAAVWGCGVRVLALGSRAY